ncbi:MAG: hypothetical protein WCK65_12105 [Rhodospirillaceae bacterium]
MPAANPSDLSFSEARLANMVTASRISLRALVDAPPALAAAAVETLLKPDLPALTRSYGDWLDGVVALRTRPTGDRRVVGALSSTVLDALTALDVAPSSAAITIADTDVFHLTRNVKTSPGRAISFEDVRRLPELLDAPEAVLRDREDGSLLYI